jgi:DNA adenine methylase
MTYHAIKDNVEDLIFLLKKHQKMNNKEHFYKIRNMDRDKIEYGKLSNIEKAARIIFLNKTCYNGLYRVNSKGLFNVPYGKYENPAICEDIVLRQISYYLNSNAITILNKDFEQAILTADKNSFIYFDPPYHSPGKNNFTGYQANGFDENEQVRLRNAMIEMTKRGIKCLLSNSDTEYIRELYKCESFEIISILAKRAINSDSAGRGSVNELLIKNWEE